VPLVKRWARCCGRPFHFLLEILAKQKKGIHVLPLTASAFVIVSCPPAAARSLSGGECTSL
jgi:hypothetical protein